MARNLNLPGALVYIHWATPADLSGLLQDANAKMEELGLTVGRRDAATPQHVDGAPSVNVRGILDFIADVEPLCEGDTPNITASKKDAQRKLVQLTATLRNRCAAAGFKAPEPAEAPVAPPLPTPTPNPKPLA